MLQFCKQATSIAVMLLLSFTSYSKPTIYVNQVGFDTKSSKIAVIGVETKLDAKTTFNIIDNVSHKIVFTAFIGKAQSVEDWKLGKSFYQADFSSFEKAGNYKITSMGPL